MRTKISSASKFHSIRLSQFLSTSKFCPNFVQIQFPLPNFCPLPNFFLILPNLSHLPDFRPQLNSTPKFDPSSIPSISKFRSPFKFLLPLPNLSYLRISSMWTNLEVEEFGVDCRCRPTPHTLLAMRPREDTAVLFRQCLCGTSISRAMQGFPTMSDEPPFDGVA